MKLPSYILVRNISQIKIFNCVFCFSYSIFYDYMVYYVLATYINKKIHIIWSGKYYEYLCFHRTPSAKAEIFK